MLIYADLAEGRDRIAVIGLGYVGLPLAVSLAKHFSVVGFDLKADRIAELNAGHDRTREVSNADLQQAEIEYSNDPQTLATCRLMIVAVPTPIDENRTPDLRPLKSACEIAGPRLRPGACVVFESTVFPGATEDICVPLLAHHSGLQFGRDFTVGYSPERINPGDRQHTLATIVKVVSGSDGPTLEMLEQVYGRVVDAGIHTASCIKVAEAAKVIENTQRDINIALMNELAMIFDKIGIDTREVLTAAGTKWNFLPFQPGLVGGHCIGVDPYYLTSKAQSLGYRPEMILAGRRINDGMGKWVAEKAVKLLIAADKRVRGARMAVLGITFKEDVPDLRNTRVVDIIKELQEFGIGVRVHDPLADPREAGRYYGVDLMAFEDLPSVDGVIVAVAHRCYRDAGLPGVSNLCGNGKALVMDLKGVFDPPVDASAMTYWRL